MRSDESFQNCYRNILKKTAEHPQIEQPFLSRKRKCPNDSKRHHPLTVEDHYSSMCYESIDPIVQAIMT